MDLHWSIFLKAAGIIRCYNPYYYRKKGKNVLLFIVDNNIHDIDP